MIQLKQFNPQKFIDREFEQELFEDLLTFQDAARILSICDASGMGKSHLLEMFRYRCRVTTRPRTPVSLIDLKQLPDQSPMFLVKEIVKDLASLDVPFPNFNAYDNARVSKDFEFIRGSVYLQGASFKEARDVRIAGTMANVERVELMHMTVRHAELTAEQNEKAEEVCVRSFLDDLRAHCATQPIVLLIDSFERCGERLYLWLRDHFLENYFFDPAKRPAKLLLVIAGREAHNFELHWPAEDCANTVKSVAALNRWTRADVEQCLKVHGLHYEEQDIDAFHRLIEMGIPPSQVVQMIESLVAQRRAA
ncbi:MAG: hypothetical protein MI924_38395 [Chloroflexales bacterium]|nr:hypothetical protein [Chloroflexales bacterium]